MEHYTYDLSKIVEDLYSLDKNKYPNFDKEEFIRYYRFMEFEEGDSTTIVTQPYYRDLWKEIEGIIATQAVAHYYKNKKQN